MSCGAPSVKTLAGGVSFPGLLILFPPAIATLSWGQDEHLYLFLGVGQEAFWRVRFFVLSLCSQAIGVKEAVFLQIL